MHWECRIFASTRSSRPSAGSGFGEQLARFYTHHVRVARKGPDSPANNESGSFRECEPLGQRAALLGRRLGFGPSQVREAWALAVGSLRLATQARPTIPPHRPQTTGTAEDGGAKSIRERFYSLTWNGFGFRNSCLAITRTKMTVVVESAKNGLVAFGSFMGAQHYRSDLAQGPCWLSNRSGFVAIVAPEYGLAGWGLFRSPSDRGNCTPILTDEIVFAQQPFNAPALF
ncbi:hypothetical protein PSPO01_13839 [Paraphaeosphaeria sporulosa]